MIEYDIVIIGGTAAGRYAALKASQYGAKAALVEPSTNPESICIDALIEITNSLQKLKNSNKFGIYDSHLETQNKYEHTLQWQALIQQILQIESHLGKIDAPAVLSAKGVDIIYGDGKFQAEPNLAFVVNNRQLIGRNYLLANGSIATIPEIEGLSKTGFLTLGNFWQALNVVTPPQDWVIIGGVPQSIELTQILQNFGFNVTLVVQQATIIPFIDEEIAFQLQTQLEASGIRVLTDSEVTQVRLIDGKKWLQVGDKAIETDEIVIVSGQQPNIESLNLAEVGVKWHKNRLLVNRKLQTTHHKIYACGDVIGGYALNNIANYEAQIAVNNALFFKHLQVNYESIPWGILTNPNLAQVGLTEAQAINRYDSSQILILKQYFKTLVSAQISDETTGICKLVILQDGTILGANIIGKNATELINIVTLAIHKKIKVSSLQNLAPIQPSFAEIFAIMANNWQQLRLENSPRWQEFLETLFQFRRERNW
ncbi:dihydrolipoyl dehydrogenase family protein [Calothrix sp. PCC 6303]|uniref:dihydrolipoyl dehydrogenase family protein n=1 Tax=Calothrix sp. PCC 6303 TaxID=1170562 RepID=UPI0002A054C0|nr:NAD(P)/FAD-dependent oxidoreductase [Calothrix sp. PCC 6303]AFZ03051.1 Mercury(II) reductase [Calothrix sp. PCC 6303]